MFKVTSKVYFPSYKNLVSPIYIKVNVLNIVVCSESVSKPLDIICKTCLESGYFPSEWKKGKVFVPVHEKGTNKLLKIIPQFLCYQFARKSLSE